MKTTELFVEQTLTGFLVLTAAAAPFIPWGALGELPEDAKGGIDISSAAGAIGAAYLLGVIFDRFADTLLERFNRWNRLLFAIELINDNKALSPDDPFPEDRLQIEVIHEGNQAWEWMDYLRSRIRISRAMAAFVPALTISIALAMGLRDREGTVKAVLAIVVAGYLVAFLVSRVLEKSSRRMPKTYDLNSAQDLEHARAMMRVTREPAFWLALFLISVGVALIPLGSDAGRNAMAGVLATGAVLSGISAWVWWRTTVTFMQFLRDFRKWAREKASDKKE
jgi:hypothetical protein